MKNQSQAVCMLGRVQGQVNAQRHQPCIRQGRCIESAMYIYMPVCYSICLSEGRHYSSRNSSWRNSKGPTVLPTPI
jgi:hypothetical protein